MAITSIYRIKTAEGMHPLTGAERSEEVMRDRIAIVGIGCRYPQAASATALWKLLMSSVDAISTYSETRFAEIDSFYANSQSRPGKVAIHRGGFLSDIDRFDPFFFEIAPREAIYMDPQQRLLLEVAWDALEDAGQTREQYLGSKTGVYIGLWNSEFEQYLYKNSTELNFYMMTGGGHASASGRVSFTYGLEGPGVTIDSACSSSLVALHSACGSLLAGETNLALAGGVNLILDTAYSEQFMKANMLAPDGRCKFGDASANGFVRSEGAGIVVLKRLADAVADGDRIYAVIRGSAVNNDGRTNGLMTTPSVEGQKGMLRQAWEAAGIEPRQLSYIEAHGTGTGVGDPVEIEAIGNSLTDGGVTSPCLLGSIKTNIGHTEAASGVAGVIKVALALHHRMLPPSLHFHNPNPKIPWDRLPVQIATEPIDLSDHTEPVLAGVNSFGLSGTNAHVVLEEFRRSVESGTAEPTGPHLFLTSAHVPESLTTCLNGALEVCASGASLYQICRTAALRRTHLDHRVAITADSISDLQEKLLATIAGSPREGVSVGRRRHGQHRIVFVAPGQGSQWPGMARQLFDTEPVFRAEFERCSAAIETETGWSLVDCVLGPVVDHSLVEIDVVQPALFAVSISLAALWRSWGLEPDAVVGHSMGEVAATYIAGVLNLDDAIAVICRRSCLMKTIRGAGAMATIELPIAAVEQRLAIINAGVSVAASNSPNTTVVAGDASGIDLLLASLESEEVFCRRIKVDVASHSSQVDPILDALRKQLAKLRPHTAATPLYSTVLRRYVDGEEMNANYWADNLRSPVLFSGAITELARTGHDIFIELSPHPILVPAILASLSAEETEATVVASLRRDKPERATMLASLGTIFNSGYPVAWNTLFAANAPQVDFPVYTFQRERCWPESETLKKRLPTYASERKFPLLGARFSSSQQHDTVLWEIDLDLTRLSWLHDHKVRGTVVLPATAHIEIALEAARSLAPQVTCSVRDLALEAAITLAEDQPQEFQIALTTQSDAVYAFEIRSRAKDTNGEWVLHSRGALESRNGSADTQPALPLGQFKENSTHCTAEKHYAVMSRTGIEYGPAFRLFAEAWTSDLPARAQSLVRIEAGKHAEAIYENYVIHPAVLDACLQSLTQVGPLVANEATGATYLPVRVDRFRMHGSMEGHDELYVLAKGTHSDDAQGIFLLNLDIVDTHGRLLASLDGIKVQRVQASNSLDVSGLLFDIDWQKSDTPVPALPSAYGQHLLIFADRTGIADALQDLVLKQGGRCTIVYPGSQYVEVEQRCIYEVDPRKREHLERLLHALGRQTPSSIVHMWSIDSAGSGRLDADAILMSQNHIAYQLPVLVQALTKASFNAPPRLWMITNGLIAAGGKSTPINITAAPLWGAGTAIAREHPELRPCLIDIVSDPSADNLYHLTAVILSGEEHEDRIALRDQSRYVPRFSHFQPKTSPEEIHLLKSGEEYRAEIRDPGILDNLSLRAFRPHRPGFGEVAIQVIATGLNFIDVAKAIGIYPGLDPDVAIMLGTECTGRVVAVGDGVSQYAVGDEVVALTPNPTTNGLLASLVELPQELVVSKPAHLTHDEAASIPLAYLTAYHSLVKLARIAPDEWVLIHAGAGGVGLAAIKIAQWAGAHVIATASSPAKHEFLKSWGVEYVLQSRSTDFACQAMEITEGRGVDIVLNSLSGEFMAKSLEILAPYGRFIELGKRDIYQDRRVGLKTFRNNISYHVVDLAAAIVEQRPYIAELLRVAIEGVSTGRWPSLPVTVFQADEIVDAFRFIAQARQIGKVAITLHRNVQVLPVLRDTLFHSDASYIITGGLGGVGSAAARWMAVNGAGYLVLVSRRQASPETDAFIRELEQTGARVTHVQTDVSDLHQVVSLMSTIRQTMPPLKGILHAAAAIDDALALDLTRERFATAMNAKVSGTWNLHAETLGNKLDFFVLFSSVAALYPQVGVTSYAAANAFLDTFARYRRALGLPATSINWGGWDNTGLAREAATVRSIDSYSLKGIMNFTQQEGLECLRTAILHDLTHLAVFRVNVEEFERSHTEDGIPPIFSVLASNGGTSTRVSTAEAAILDDLVSASSRNMRMDILEGYLQQHLSHVLKLAVDRIDRERTLGTMGLDSLMALECIRRINAGLGLALPATAAFNYPSIRQLASHILQKLSLDAAGTSEFASIVEAPAVRLASVYIEDVSEKEAIDALMKPDGAAYER